MKPVPKSLHTVSVLVAMARMYSKSTGYTEWPVIVEYVLTELGYMDEPDTYQLAAQAIRKLSKGA